MARKMRRVIIVGTAIACATSHLHGSETSQPGTTDSGVLSTDIRSGNNGVVTAENPATDLDRGSPEPVPQNPGVTGIIPQDRSGSFVPEDCPMGGPSPGNSVVIESKSVTLGATGVTVGVYLTNSVTVEAVVLPLELRTVTGGAFVSDNVNFQPQGRIAGLFPPDYQVIRFFDIPSAQTCSGPVSQTWSESTSPANLGVSPDAVFYAGVGEQNFLSPGTDGAPGAGTPSFQLTFDVSAASGQFEIDTCCVTPDNFLVFVDNSHICHPPEFTKGVITVLDCSCPFPGNPDGSGGITTLDLALVIDVVFGGGTPTFDPDCPVAREDFNCDGVVNAIDVDLVTERVFLNGAPPCQPCDGTIPPVCEPGSPSVGNSLVIESKTVATGAAAVTVGCYVTNSVGIEAIVVPLELRSIHPGAFISGNFSLTVQGRLAAAGLGSGAGRYFTTPSASNDCSGPVSQSWAVSTAAANLGSSPDAVSYLAYGASATCMASGTDGSPGSGTPSVLLTFDVTATNGQFEIDTACVTPANHLVFIECGTRTCHLPEFTKGIITIGVPPGCATATTTDPYLLACPKGDVVFSVHLRDQSNMPMVGYSDVTLDFSDCVGSEFVPQPGLYPSWPIVPAAVPSDADGEVMFSIAAGGDCPDCDVTITTGCGFSTTVPVRSTDVDGDNCVTLDDHDDALGDCRDLNADGEVDDLDFQRHVAHCCDHCFPSGPCEYLTQKLGFDPEGGFEPDDTVTIRWLVQNNPAGDACNVDSVVLWRSVASATPTWERIDVITLGQTLLPGGVIEDSSVTLIVPNYRDMCLEARLYTDCCDSFNVAATCAVITRQCPPAATCFVFYIRDLVDADEIVTRWSNPLLLALGWTYEPPKDTVIDTFGIGLVSLIRICTSDLTPVGSSGTLTIYYIKAGQSARPISCTVKQDYIEGDLCGGPNRTPNCSVDVFDIVCLIGYIFRAEAPPEPVEHADINCDTFTNVFDVVRLIDYVFRAGLQPPDCDGGPAINQ